MLNDLRLAVRSLRRAPGFAVVTILTLAIGMGATSAVFSLVNATLLDQLPYRDPDHLVVVTGAMHREQPEQQFPLSYLDIEALGGEVALFEDVAAVTGVRSFNLTAGAEVDHVSGEMTGASFFQLLGVPMTLGRAYSEDEVAPPGKRVVVLSHDLWATRFGSRADIAGTTLTLNEQPYTVIGVAAKGFRGNTDQAQLWMPLGLAGGIYGPHYIEMREFRWLSAVGRLAPGVTSAQARKGLDALASRLEKAFPKENAKFGFAATSMTDAFVEGLRKPLYLLLAGAALVLLIGCANVANLMLVRGNARRRELAVRIALGASGTQLARQTLAEMIVVCALGTLLGLVIAFVAAPLVASSGIIDLASFTRVRINALVIVVSVALSFLCAIAFGLGPALIASRVSPKEGMSDGGAGSGTSRGRRAFQSGLIGAEVAVSLVLLVGAALMTRGFARFVATDLGFKSDSLLSLRLDLTADRYKQNAQVFALLRALTSEAQSIAGVQRVAVEGPGYPTGGWYQLHLMRQAGDGKRFAARRHHVTPGYFATLGIRMREGRDFDASDFAQLATPAASGAPRSVVISRKYAERLFPGERAVGQRLLTEGQTPTPLTVIGVVDDVEHGGLRTDDTEQADIYVSAYQSPPRSPALATLYLRTAAPTNAIVRKVSDVLHQLDPSLAFYDVRGMSERLANQTSTGRFLVLLMTAFGVVGMLLASMGVYGVVSYAVGQQTREIGVRIALGADLRGVVGAVVRRGLTPVLWGAAIGLAAIWPLHRMVASVLYGISPADPTALAIATSTLFIAGALASFIPAVRAARIDPIVAMRAE